MTELKIIFMKNYRLFFKLLAALAVIYSLGVQKIKAQDNSGTEFWFTLFAETYIDHLPGVYIISYYDCTVTIDYVARDPLLDLAGDTNCTRYTVNVTGGVPLYVDIPYDLQALCWRYADDLTLPETIQKNGIRVTSTAPIALYSQFLAAASSEMTPILPVEEMGLEYIVTAYREITSETNEFNARVTVVGIEDNTSITFTLPSNAWTSSINANGAMTHGSNSTWSIMLDKGETYTVLSNDNGQALTTTPAGSSVTVNNNQGLNGMKIVANNKISVLGGTDCTWIGNDEYPGCGACDLTSTHLKPIENWETRYISTQTLQRPNQMSLAVGLASPPTPNIEPYPANFNQLSVADYLLITARDNGTTVNITGEFNYTKSLNAGEWFIYESPGNSNPLTPPPTTSPGKSNHLVEANNPIQVIQMMKGWQCDNNNPADPTQMLVVEENMWRDNYIITNPTQYANNFFVFIVKEPSGGNQARNSLNLVVNGVNIPIPAGNSPTNDGTGGWSQMGAVEPYYYQRINVAAGGAIRTKSVPLTPGGITYPFAFYASGSTNASSYGYMGGNVCKLEAYAHADTANICLGEPVTFILDSTKYGGSIASILTYDYTWTIASATDTIYTFTGFGADPTHSYTPTSPPVSAGVYEGYLYITDNASCSAVDTFVVVIDSVITSPTVGSDVVVCEGDTINLTANSTISGVAYSWTGPLAFADTAQNPVILNATMTMSGAYAVTIAKNGCISNPVSMNVTVNPSDTIALSSVVGTDAQSLCVNTAIANITYSVSGGGTGASATGLPTGVTGSYSGGVFTISGMPSDTGMFNYMVITSGTCTPDTINGSINVNSLPVIDSIPYTNESSCGANDGTITIAATGTGLTYSIDGGTTFVASNSFTGLMAGTYTIVVENASGCRENGGVISISSAGAPPAPAATIAPNPSCTGDTITLEVTSPVVGETYNWTGPNAYTATGELVVISGATPSMSGLYTVTATVGSCVSSGTTINVTINPNAAITLSSAAGTDAQTVCENTAITTITYNVSGGGTGASATGLPTGVTGSYSSGVFTISGTPTQTGTFNYTVTTTGTCAQTTASGSITINPNAAIVLTSASGTDAQTVCENTAITTITYTVSGGGTGASATGLPTGVTGSYSAGVFTINGIPTQTGTFNYTVTTSGTCASTTANGTITINPNDTITLNSALGTDAQTVCENTAITDITYDVSGGGTGASATGLPTGVTGSYSAGVFTINGIPTQTGTFNYTVTTTGICASTTANGTITINPNDTIVLSSAVGTDAQTVCENTAITNITYDVSGGGTGANATGLPTGITGSYSVGVFTINGTPTQTGTFNYTVTTTGTCASSTANGTITINPNDTITLSSALGTDAQTVCENTAISDITYDVSGGGTGASATGLPTGLTGSYSAGVFTINGIPTQTGTFNYTITTTGTCAQTTATGSITINPNAVIALTSALGTDAQTVCENTAITTITYNVSGGGTGAGATGLPTGVTGSYSGGVFTISGTPTQTGTFNYTVTTTGTCAQTTASGSITINNCSVPTASFTASSLNICIGDTVTFIDNSTGTNISNWNWVIDGGTPGTANTQGPHDVVFSTAGSYNITLVITDDNGTDDTTITLVVNPQPAVVANATATAVCEGDTVTLSGSGATSYSWDNGVTDGVAFIPTVTTTYTVTGTDGNGCQNTDAITVTVNNCTQPTASFTTSYNSICIGNSITFTDNSTGMGITNWNWTFNGGTPSTANTQGSHTIAFDTAGTFNINLQITDINGVDDTTIAITVNPLPVVVANATATAICQGDTVTLSGTGATSYSWDNGVNDGVAFTPTATNTYTVTGTDGNGCSNTDQVTVTVNNCTQPTASFTTSSNSICIGNSITFTDNSTGINVNSWNWMFNGGTPNTANTQGTHTVTFNTAGTFNIILQVTDDNGTDDTTMTITVNPNPTVNAGTDQIVCEGSPVTLSGSGATSYSWDNGVNDGVAFTPVSTTTYTVTGTDGNGCQNTDVVTVTVNNCTQPTASFTTSAINICVGQTITYVDNSTGGITGWNWTFNGGTPSSASTQGSHTVTYFTAGTFNVTLQVSNSNGVDDTVMTVMVNPKPQVTFLTTDDNCKESTGNITGIVTLGSYPITFSWNNGSTDSTLSNLTSGTYSVLITDNNGCTNTEQVIINDLQEGCDYFVYVPNVFTPNEDGNNDVFYVRGKGIRSMNIEIYNRWGNKVFESSNVEVGWDGKYGAADQNSAVFVYVISAVLENGKKVEESGNISIIK